MAIGALFARIGTSRHVRTWLLANLRYGYCGVSCAVAVAAFPFPLVGVICAVDSIHGLIYHRHRQGTQQTVSQEIRAGALIGMAIYKMVGKKEKLVQVAPTSFGQEGVLERADLQRMLRDLPDVLEERLLIISEEFGNWQDSNRRIDLLALDDKGRLVVVELKRGDTGAHMDLQAIRYAAMVANMTFQQIVDNYQDYLDKRVNEAVGTDEADDAEIRIREHLVMQEPDNHAVHTEVPRIILAAEDFSKELTTCVMWLNDSWLRNAGHEIKCVRLQPHRNGDDILVESSVVIPLPEASDYQTQLGQREREIRSEPSGKATTDQGAAAFKQSIGRASEKFQPGLQWLYDEAISMEQDKIVELSTYSNRKGDYIRLNLLVPGKEWFLVSFNNLLWNGKERGGEISFWPVEDDLALDSISKIDELVGETTSKSRLRHRRLSGKKYDWEAIMAAIRDAYREAKLLTVAEKSYED